MTNTTNGWPGKPGVPLNPKKEGWHWVQECDLEPECAFWRASLWLEHTLGCWETKGREDDFQPYEISNWTYLGPCLTSDEATALQARVAELERLAGLADSWITAALECKDWHWDADQHEAATHTRDELRAALAILGAVI